MRTTFFITSCVAAVVAATTASAQTSAPAPAPSARTDVAPKVQAGQWRASKLIGVNIYNEQNEKLGDINEVVLDPSGKVTGYVVGVGGFLGAGEHDILIEPTKIKFVNEPVRAAAATPPATTGTTTAPATTRDANNTTATRATTTRWYPDHGVLNATKDQLKAMPQFKYSATN
jgi:sporulation protein YlmC with PRC-barrel domain